MKRILSVLFTVGFSVGATLWILRWKPELAGITNHTESVANSGISTSPVLLNSRSSLVSSAGLPDFVEAANKSVHAVVHVKVQATRENLIYDPFAQLFGLSPHKEQFIQQGFGSGVIISSDGYIVTNNHVINGADKIEVTLNNRKVYSARLVGKDPSTDLALLKIDEQNLPYLLFGNSEEVKVGEWVLAVGNPFNLNSTVTAGIISAKGRNRIIDVRMNPIESFLQTDAAVNPGNSGGALVNVQGELIGINTAIASNNGTYQGYSFAVPSNIVRKVVSDLLEFGEVRRAYLGVSISDMDSKTAKEAGMSEVKGVMVNGVSAGGSAEEAGIRQEDIILSIHDYPVNSVSELQEQIAKYRPGDKVRIKFLRKSREYQVECTLKSLEQMIKGQEASEKENVASSFPEKNSSSLSINGLELTAVSEQEMRNLGISGGVKIKSISPDSKLYRAGVKPGFVVTSINKTPVHSPSEFREILNKTRGGVLLEGVYPGGTKAYYGFGN